MKRQRRLTRRDVLRFLEMRKACGDERRRIARLLASRTPRELYEEMVEVAYARLAPGALASPRRSIFEGLLCWLLVTIDLHDGHCPGWSGKARPVEYAAIERRILRALRGAEKEAA